MPTLTMTRRAVAMGGILPYDLAAHRLPKYAVRVLKPLLEQYRFDISQPIYVRSYPTAVASPSRSRHHARPPLSFTT
jgi:hypothetical protein